VRHDRFELNHCTHEEEGEVEVGEGCPCKKKVNGVVDEFDLEAG